MSGMPHDPEHLQILADAVANADKDPVAERFLRDLIARCGERAPLPDLIAIGQCLVNIYREHLRAWHNEN